MNWRTVLFAVFAFEASLAGRHSSNCCLLCVCVWQLNHTNVIKLNDDDKKENINSQTTWTAFLKGASIASRLFILVAECLFHSILSCFRRPFPLINCTNGFFLSLSLSLSLRFLFHYAWIEWIIAGVCIQLMNRWLPIQCVCLCGYGLKWFKRYLVSAL